MSWVLSKSMLVVGFVFMSLQFLLIAVQLKHQQEEQVSFFLFLSLFEISSSSCCTFNLRLGLPANSDCLNMLAYVFGLMVNTLKITQCAMAAPINSLVCVLRPTLTTIWKKMHSLESALKNISTCFFIIAHHRQYDQFWLFVPRRSEMLSWSCIYAKFLLFYWYTEFRKSQKMHAFVANLS